MIHVYDTEGVVVKEDTCKMDGTINGAKVVVDGLDATKEYKIMLESNSGNCWVQAVKFEGTPREKTEMTLANGNTATPNRIVSNFYLEQNGDMLTAQGLAEGQVLRYTTGEDPVNVASEIFPEKGYKLTVNTPVDLNLRAISGTTMTDVVTKHYELLVPEITDTLLISVKADTTKTSEAYDAWTAVYTNTNKVLWTTTAGDYQYIYKAAPGYEKRITLAGDTIDVPAVSFNRKNTMYLNVTEPSIIKVTSAPYMKTRKVTQQQTVTNEETGAEETVEVQVEEEYVVDNGKHIQIDGNYYECDENGVFVANVEPGVHTFVACKWGSEAGIQMIEVVNGTSLAGVVNAALAEAINSGEKVLNVKLDKSANYTCNTPVYVPDTYSVVLDGNEAELNLGAGANFVSYGSLVLSNLTINAENLGNNALIQMGANPVKTVLVPASVDAEGNEVAAKEANGQIVDAVKINNCTINNLPSYIYSDGGKTWIINEFSIDNSVIKLNTTDAAMTDQALIRANGYGIVSNMIAESTIYNVGKADAAAKYLIQYNNSARADRMNAEMAYVILRNNTVVNAWSVGGQFANYSGVAGKNTTTLTMMNNIFVGMPDVARRFVGGNNGSAIITFENNTYMKADGTFDNASNYDKSGTAIEMDPKFKDAANGDFTVGKSTEQARLETGDPRWLVPYVEPAVAITEPREWDFTTGAAYAEALKADTNNWGVLSKGRYQNLNELTDAELVVGENALEMTAGLRFTAAANNILVGTESGNLYLQYTGGNVTMTIPNCKAGYKVSVDWCSSGKNKEAKLTFENTLEPEATTTSTSKINNIVTVAEDGDVIITGNANTRLYALLVASEEAVGINNAIVNTTVNGPVYNLAGQKVDANFKGIVIMNGKKVMVK